MATPAHPRTRRIRRLANHSLAAYLLLTFTLSWGSAAALLLPKLLRGEPVSSLDGLMAFPLMILGPAASSLLLTGLLDGRRGLADLWARIHHARLPAGAYAAVLVAPAVLLATLFALSGTLSSAFTPHLFPTGIVFGLMAGALEEIGWTGFALPRLTARFGVLRGTAVLGVIWGVWHLPVIDFLGVASPHGADLPWFFLAFVGVVTAMRLLIGLAATRTNSVFVAQIIHASLTGSLAMLSPSPITPAQEAFWYTAFAAALWLAVAVILWAAAGKRQPRHVVAAPAPAPAGL